MSNTEKILCCFTLGGQQYLSELLLDAEKSSLNLHSRHQIPYDPEPHSLYGESLDYQKISLFECVGDPPDSAGLYPDIAHTRSSFPHYAVLGQRHIAENEKAFKSISFRTDDLELVFANQGLFGSAAHAPDHQNLKAWLESCSPNANITSNNDHIPFHHAADQNFVEHDISVGFFSVAVELKATANSYKEIHYVKTTVATLRFKERKSLTEALDGIIVAQHFFTIIAGRYQGVHSLLADVENPKLSVSQNESDKMRIHWSFAPTCSTHLASNLRDIPVTPQVDSDEFYTLFRQWSERHDRWLPARLRIINWQKAGRVFDENRLVAAANAFDILPYSAYPETGDLSEETLEARRQCKALIRALRSGPEREQALNTLSFWGGKNLKLKVLSRSKIIHDSFGDYFVDLDLVLTTAINMRNYFVHGTNKFGYEHYEHLMPFLTDALEFAFIASDLIECGWNAKQWSSKYLGYSHPLAAFYRRYTSELGNFVLAKQNAQK
ncbi:HEPN domain-containing protein [Pseudomonas viridiflava]|uniref:Uncharacterized protein n=1 Tax=Pseudomonas viridiflava TaxID=33069 RepID=A0A3M5P744_PSEVI|nr:HEPN domain-containing protein [Pseudomonas viridiflava]RMT80579.1 hypothetical protein ALP40_00869 [Pseudomonas viridiflava]